MRDLLDEVTVSTRTISGTDWPVVDQLHRTGPREWTVTRELCNGVPRSSETYRSERAAREAFAERLSGPKPRAAAPANVRLALRVTQAEWDAWDALRASQSQPTLADTVREAMAVAVARGSTR